MLRLTRSDGAAPPAVPPAEHPGIQRWYDNDGAVVAWGQSRGRQRSLYLPAFASFTFSDDDTEVRAVVPSLTPAAHLEDAFWRTVVPLALQARGVEVLHASAVVTSQGAVALCATSETGKSTIAYGLSLRGYPLWADDAVALRIGDSAVETLPVPFGIRLRPASAEYFAVDSSAVNHARLLTAPPPAAATSLHAVVVLERSGDRSAEPDMLWQLPPGAAFTAMLTHAYCFDITDFGGKRRMVEHFLALAARLPVYALRFQAGLGRLPQLLELIERTLGVSPAAGR